MTARHRIAAVALVIALVAVGAWLADRSGASVPDPTVTAATEPLPPVSDPHRGPTVSGCIDASGTALLTQLGDRGGVSVTITQSDGTVASAPRQGPTHGLGAHRFTIGGLNPALPGWATWNGGGVDRENGIPLCSPPTTVPSTTTTPPTTTPPTTAPPTSDVALTSTTLGCPSGEACGTTSTSVPPPTEATTTTAPVVSTTVVDFPSTTVASTVPPSTTGPTSTVVDVCVDADLDGACDPSLPFTGTGTSAALVGVALLAVGLSLVLISRAVPSP